MKRSVRRSGGYLVPLIFIKKDGTDRKTLFRNKKGRALFTNKFRRPLFESQYRVRN